MKLIDSKAFWINQEGYDLASIKKQIEIAGRTCYKSEDRITNDSADKFVDMLCTRGHTAMLEHGTVYLTIPYDYDGVVMPYIINKYIRDPYSKIILNGTAYGEVAYVTTNYRVLVQNGWLDDLQFLTEPTGYHSKRYSARFICSRSIANEIVRHRSMSFAQESSRYCNYSKDKFGNELTFIIPTWYKGDAASNDKECHMQAEYEANCYDVEHSYLRMIKWGATPQEAREILPLGLKTEIVVTGFEKDWEHFFDLRCDSAAHPDIQKLANELRETWHS